MMETRGEKILYKGIVPVVAAVVGAVAATWFQSFTVDKAQLNDVVQLIQNPALNPQQKLQALAMYKEITDRPWEIIRSLTSYLGLTISMGIGAAVAGGWFRRS